MKAVITVGISGSGKSTWASKQSGYTVINRDDVRVELMERDGKQFSWSGWSWKREDEVTKICNTKIAEMASAGIDIIISDTNLNRGRRNSLAARLKELGYDVSYQFFHGVCAEQHMFVDQCVKNDMKRRNPVGFETIHHQWLQFKENYPESIRKYVPDASLPKAIVVDIDGTVAKKGDRDVFDYSKVHLDTPIPHVVDIVRRYSSDHVIIFCSGRDDNCWEETLLWLEANDIPNNALLMRRTGDTRRDSIIKEEIFFKYIAPEYNVTFAIDDRKQMVQLWEDIGVPCLNVGSPYEHF